jgi:hypothetical protein
MKSFVIHAEPGAPLKPAVGQPCNGCGVCCLSESCPLGVALTGRHRGACAALRWSASSSTYLCGALTEPRAVLAQRLPALVQPLLPALTLTLKRFAPRWISSGSGCDCSLDVTPAVAPPV